jgi:splicing factor 45
MRWSVQDAQPSSKVILLKNMVEPGDADEGLEEEVAEEVAKYGGVVQVLIFVVSGADVPKEQAVRYQREAPRPTVSTLAHHVTRVLNLLPP